MGAETKAEVKAAIKLTKEEELTAEWLRYLYLKYNVAEKVKKGEKPPEFDQE
jgi:hypothetical protein